MDAYTLPPEADGGPGSQVAAKARQRFQVILDRITPHTGPRWLGWLVLLLLFVLRIWALKGFYIIAYALGIFNLNLLLGFITPQVPSRWTAR